MNKKYFAIFFLFSMGTLTLNGADNPVDQKKRQQRLQKLIRRTQQQARKDARGKSPKQQQAKFWQEEDDK